MNVFLKSALTEENPFISTNEVVDWVGMQSKSMNVEIRTISFDQLKLWNFNDGKLTHESGKFFSIEGVLVSTNKFPIRSWMQPIINQPEIGYLGFITKEINGILYFLIQAKVEPGNVNHVQLSPTLQATKSNYTKVHEGSAPEYLECFLNAQPDQILLDQLQSEQGARFYKKRNRNIIIKVDEEIEIQNNFIWLTLGQIKRLMTFDNLVNMDTRTVISGISYLSKSNEYVSISKENIFLRSYLSEHDSLHDFHDIISFITKQKCQYELEVISVALQSLSNWHITEREIRHVSDKYFKVIATDVTIENREVHNWTQPMVQPAQEGICAFVGKVINNVLHFAVQAKLECGNFDTVELAPTVQCLTGNYRNERSLNKLPFLDYVLNSKKEQVVYDTLQSEEGGRFYKEQNRNIIIIAGNEIDTTLPPSYMWMTLNQLQLFIQFNNYINVQARSLLAALNLVNY